MRDPVDAAKDLRAILRERGRSLEVQHDLGLDARVREARERAGAARLAEVSDGPIVDMRPDRLIYAVLGPDVSIRETDLAPDGDRACAHVVFVDEPSDFVS